MSQCSHTDEVGYPCVAQANHEGGHHFEIRLKRREPMEAMAVLALKLGEMTKERDGYRAALTDILRRIEDALA